jgi:phosphoribosylaminoimidazolecarboxamide formyltransferase/IMP cyclohydrolase
VNNWYNFAAQIIIMDLKIQSALISVFYKDGLEPLLHTLNQQGVKIYSTGGTRTFIEGLGLPCIPVEEVTNYPSILGGRVKTLHPKIFGGILGRRDEQQDLDEMQTYEIPMIDLVIVDLYPFEETIAQTNEEKLIIEKIDIGGPSMIRAAAKNFSHLTVLADKKDYSALNEILIAQNGTTALTQRRSFAAKAFEVVRHYDTVIANYFNAETKVLRYGENPHQEAKFTGQLDLIFEQLNGKELSYNNLVDVDAALQLIAEFQKNQPLFAIIKHTNVCGIALGENGSDAWKRALAGDPESAFGGIIITNGNIDAGLACEIQDIFFEVLIADSFDAEALEILKQKKNRIILRQKTTYPSGAMQRRILNGTLEQDSDIGNFQEWSDKGGRTSTELEKEDMIFANIVCKHLKSNAIALVKQGQLIGKGCGQTSRIDALRHAIEKAKQFKFDLHGSVLASDAFFPFDDCVKIAHEHGIAAFIQPGGSIRDQDSIDYCQKNNLAMVMTGMRHFKH